MNIDLSELLADGAGKKRIAAGTIKEYTVSPEMDEFSCSLGEYKVLDKGEFLIKVTVNGKNRVNISGDTELVLGIPCDRCLTVTKQPIEIRIDENVDFDNLSENQEYVTDRTIDVEKLLYSEIILNLPMKVLCKDDCKGICWKCGQNLNLKDCGCDTFVPDPRMAVISDIFKNFKP